MQPSQHKEYVEEVEYKHRKTQKKAHPNMHWGYVDDVDDWRRVRILKNTKFCNQRRKHTRKPTEKQKMSCSKNTTENHQLRESTEKQMQHGRHLNWRTSPS